MDLYTKYKRCIPYLLVAIVTVLVIMYSKKLEKIGTMNTQMVNAKLLNRTVKSNGNKIPNCIIQTFNKDNVTINMFNVMKSFIDMNPEYSYVYFNDIDCRNYMKHNFPEMLEHYDCIIPGAYKADIFRYCYLYNNGGVYIDAAMTALQPLSKMIEPGDTFITPEDDNRGILYNAFIACEPRNNIIKSTIATVTNNIKNRVYNHDPLYITGPGTFGEVFKKVMNVKEIKENTTFPGGIKIIETDHLHPKHTGYVLYNGIKFLLTKYPTYYDEKFVSTGMPKYPVLWGGRRVYKDDYNYPVYLNWTRIINLP